MRQACKHSFCILSVIACVLVTLLQGCVQQKETSLRLGEWIHLMCMKGELEASSDSPAYFMNVPEGSLYYEDFQTAVDWNILEEGIAVDPEAVLTREWAAYTLIRLSAKELNTNKHNIKDINQSQFSEYVQTAVDAGLFTLEKGKRFYPKRVISKEEAERLLEQVYTYLNTKTFETAKNEITWKDDFALIEEEPTSYDALTNTITYPIGTQIAKGDICKIEAEEEVYLQVEEVKEEAEQIVVSTSVPKIEDTISSLDLADTFEVDFTKAEIIEESEGFLIQEVSANDPVSLMSIRQLQRTYSFKDWKVTYTVTTSGIKAEVYKTLPSGLYVYGKASLSQVRPTYQWQMHAGKIEEGYFRVDFKTNESIGTRISDYKTLYGDFSEVKADDFLSSLQKVLKKRSEMEEVTIPLATIQVPVPNAPLVKLVMQLQLKLYADGRCELSLTQAHTMGMEIRNGRMRVINDNQNQSEAVIKANTGITCGLNLAMKVATMSLTDVSCEAGGRANIKTTFHLYDASGQHDTKETNDIPCDIASDLSQGNGNVLVCGDMNAYWILRMQLNQSGTLAGRLGFSRQLDLLNEKNGKLIPGSKTHIENWHFVDHCSRKDRIRPITMDPVKSSQIQLTRYAMIVAEEEIKEIGISALPEGIRKEDLVYHSENEAIASVIDGYVKGNQEGSTIITIASEDGTYSAKINILVKAKK